MPISVATDRTQGEPLYRVRLPRPVVTRGPSAEDDAVPPPFSRTDGSQSTGSTPPRKKNLLVRMFQGFDAAVTRRLTLPYGHPPPVQTDASLRTLPGMRKHLIELATPVMAEFGYPEAATVRGEIHYLNLAEHFHQLRDHYQALINPHGDAHGSDRVLDFLREMEDRYVRTQIERRHGHGRDAGYHTAAPNKITSQYTMASGLRQTWKDLNRTTRDELTRLRRLQAQAPAAELESRIRYLESLERFSKAQKDLSGAVMIPHAVQEVASAVSGLWRLRTTPGGDEAIGSVGESTSDSRMLSITGGAKGALTPALNVSGGLNVTFNDTDDLVVDRDASVNNLPSSSIAAALSVNVTTPVVGAAATLGATVTPFGRYYESADPRTAKAAEITDRTTATHSRVAKRIDAAYGAIGNEWTWGLSTLGGARPTLQAERELSGIDGKDLARKFQATQILHTEAEKMDAALRDAHSGFSDIRPLPFTPLSQHVAKVFPLYSEQLQSMGVPRDPSEVADQGSKLPTVKSVPSTASGRDPSAPARHGTTKIKGGPAISVQLGLNPEAYTKLVDDDGNTVFNKVPYLPFGKIGYAANIFFNETYLTRQQRASDEHPNLDLDQMPRAVTEVVRALHERARSDPRPSEAFPFGRHPALTLANARFPRHADGTPLIDWRMRLVDDTVPTAARDLDLYGARTDLAEPYRRWFQALDIHQSGAPGLEPYALDPRNALPALLKSYRDYAQDSHDIWFHIARARETAGKEHGQHLQWLNDKVFDGAYRVNARSSEETKRFFYLYATSLHDLGYSTLRGPLDATLSALTLQRPAMSEEDFDHLMHVAAQIQQQREAQYAFIDHADNGNHASQQERIHMVGPSAKSRNYGFDSTATIGANLALIDTIRKKISAMPDLGPLNLDFSTTATVTGTRQPLHPNQNRKGESMEFAITMAGGPQLATMPLVTIIGHVTDALMRNKTLRRLPDDTRATVAKDVGNQVVAMMQQEGWGALGNSASLRFMARIERPLPVGDEQPRFKLAHMALLSTLNTTSTITTPNLLQGTPGSLTIGVGSNRKTTTVPALSRGDSLRANLANYQSLSGNFVMQSQDATDAAGEKQIDFEATRQRFLAAPNANASAAWFGAVGDPILAALCDIGKTSRLEPNGDENPDPLGYLDGEYILRGPESRTHSADARLALNYRHGFYKNLSKPSAAAQPPLSAYARLRGLFEHACPDFLNRPDGDEDLGWRDLHADFSRIEARTREMGMNARIEFYTRDPEGRRLLALFRESMGVLAEVSTSVRLGADDSYGTHAHTRAVDVLSRKLAPQAQWRQPGVQPATPSTAPASPDGGPAPTDGALQEALKDVTRQRIEFIYRHVPGGPEVLRYNAGLGPLVEAPEEETEGGGGPRDNGAENELAMPSPRSPAITLSAAAASPQRADSAPTLLTVDPTTAPALLRTPAAIRRKTLEFTDPDKYGPFGKEAIHAAISTVNMEASPYLLRRSRVPARSDSTELDLTTLAHLGDTRPPLHAPDPGVSSTELPIADPPPLPDMRQGTPNPMLAEVVCF